MFGQFMPGMVGGAKDFVLIDRTTGTRRGDCTNSGGLAASFDGNTNQGYGGSSVGGTSGNGWVGKTLAVPAVIGKVTAFGANNNGYSSNGSISSVTLTLRGKNGAAPTGLTNGTILGSITFTNKSNESTGREILSSDLNTVWDHVFLQIETSGARAVLSELEIYAWE